MTEPSAARQRETRETFILSNMGLVHALARRLKGRGIEYEELVSAGCIGLLKAADGFEPERGLKFSTYAVPMIVECRDNRKESLHDKKTSIEASNSFAFEESRERRGY